MADTSERYRFLNAQLAKEPFINDILGEVEAIQRACLKGGSGELATLDILVKSRNIRMPFSPQRERAIAYLLDQVNQNHPRETGRILSFSFRVDETTKKLDIVEKSEYTVFMNEADAARIQQDRDQVSTENLLELLKNFRLFNLTKLVKKAKNRLHLSNIIRSQLGITIFTFKNYSFDRNNLDITEDYCFHRDNYENVRSRLNLENIRKIIGTHAIQINRRLSRFGILNPDISDYRDTKLDYILNIMLEDIPSSLDRKDLMEVRNFHSLRACLIKVDKLMDPVVALNNDIVTHIRECGICKTADILAVLPSLTAEMLEKWAAGNLESKKIFRHHDPSGEMLYIHGEEYMNRLLDLHGLIITKPETFASLTERERNDYLSLMDLLCTIGRGMTDQAARATAVLGNADNVEKAKSIILAYEDYRKQMASRSSAQRRKTREQKKSILGGIIEFIKSLFGGRGEGEDEYDEEGEGSGVARTAGSGSSARRRRPLTRETVDIYDRVKRLSSPLIPLSDYIEIKPENEGRIDSLISELRDNNLKIIIPIYGARTTLYPIRSQKLLIADVEYLCVNPDVADSPESIRTFTDSLTGYQLRDEFLPGRAIVAIEKYLLTIYRQKRAQKLKKG